MPRKAPAKVVNCQDCQPVSIHRPSPSVSRRGITHPNVLRVVVAEERSSIDAVSQAAKGHGKLDADHVGNTAGEEGDDGEGRVQSRVGVVLGLRVELSGTSQTTKCIKHSRAEEAHQGDHEQLHDRRGIPKLSPANLETLVHPSGGT